MARMVVRSFAASTALALAGVAAFAQAPLTSSTPHEPPALSYYNARIVSQLGLLADLARASENRAFAVRAQAQAAALLWTLDADQARLIYRRAFESLTPGGAPSRAGDQTEGAAKTDQTSSETALTPFEKRQLRSELLNQITARDPELAQALAREMADSEQLSKGDCFEGASPGCSPQGKNASASPSGIGGYDTREAAERRELLMSAALQIVERDPKQAMAFAQMSVALGISPNLARLLILLRNVDPERADLLFYNALERLQQSPPAGLGDIHTLGTYVVSVVNGRDGQQVSKSLAIRFLNFAISEIGEHQSAASKPARRDESATLYFIGRQLVDLCTRYSIDRLDQVRRYLSDAAEGPSYETPIDPDLMRATTPADIAREAREATNDAQRDSLYARAAIAWLTEGDVREAQAAALRIAEGATRDRVLAQVSRRYVSDKRIEDAVDVARRIADLNTRVDLYVLSGGAAIASRDTARAIDLLNEANACSLKAPASLEQVEGLLKTAATFAEVDAVRSFEVLESAVKAINEFTKHKSADHQSSALGEDMFRGFSPNEMLSSSFVNTLTALARVDFDRALMLAQQLTGDEAAVIAQLAVLRGGLADRPLSQSSSAEEGPDSSNNH